MLPRAQICEVVASLVPELPSLACICDGPDIDLSGPDLIVTHASCLISSVGLTINVGSQAVWRRSAVMLCRESRLGAGSNPILWQLFDALSRRFAPRQGRKF